jgi:DNA-binding transcriptional ArsR family regulator
VIAPALPALDAVFHALADPTRRRMIERLTRGPASVSELARPLSISLPAVVQHLQVLETATLVKTEKSGRVRTCTLNTRAISQAETWLTGRRQAWQHRFDRLGQYLEEMTDDPT